MIVLRILGLVAMQAIWVCVAALCSWLADIGLGIYQWADGAVSAALRRSFNCKDAFDAIDRSRKAQKAPDEHYTGITG